MGIADPAAPDIRLAGIRSRIRLNAATGDHAAHTARQQIVTSGSPAVHITTS